MWQRSQSDPHRSGRQRARERIWGERVGPGRGQRLSQSCRATWPDSRDCLWPALVCLGLGVLDGGVAGLLGPMDGAATVDRHSSSELSGNPGAGQGGLPRLWRVPPGPLSLRQPKFSSVMAFMRTAHIRVRMSPRDTERLDPTQEHRLLPRVQAKGHPSDAAPVACADYAGTVL